MIVFFIGFFLFSFFRGIVSIIDMEVGLDRFVGLVIFLMGFYFFSEIVCCFGGEVVFFC